MVNVKWIMGEAEGTKNSLLKVYFFDTTDMFQAMTVKVQRGI